LEKLQTLWDGQITVAEKASLQKLVAESPKAASSLSPLDAIQWAEEHLFERRSVVSEHEIWRHALEHTRGQNVSLADIQSAAKQRDYIRFDDKPGKITLREHLQREWDMVCAAKDGRGKFASFHPDFGQPNPRLDAEQRQAVERIMASTDFVTLFRGGAGTGKSFTLREVQSELVKSGHAVRVVAPQRQQVMDLERDGFQNVQTVSAVLTKGELPQNSVLLVDEAGQIGGKQMHALFQLAQQNHCRLILSGDTRQHGAVEASDALRAIEQYAGLDSVELTNIRRQNPAVAKSSAERERIQQYRSAVEAARDGKLAQSFLVLDKLNAIEQCTQQHEKLAARYLDLAKQHQSCVVVSQSWHEIHQVNEEIRSAFQREQMIGGDETTVTALLPVNLTEAQKRDARSYDKNSVLVFNRNVRGGKAGDLATLKSVDADHLTMEHAGRTVKIPFKQLDKITVCQPKEMALSVGDKLQLKANGRSVENKKLANGELVTVKSIQADGRIGLTDGRTLNQNFRQFVRGYAVTSYASQGKSVDYVLFSDSAVKAATNHQQWYVTISRGKKGINIFTTDKEELRENITRSGDRPLALDAVAGNQDARTVAVRLIQETLRRRTFRQATEARGNSHSMRM
jgi:ATP-dependent exoDNAse (exonuclease V) alpha subunit